MGRLARASSREESRESPGQRQPAPCRALRKKKKKKKRQGTGRICVRRVSRPRWAVFLRLVRSGVAHRARNINIRGRRGRARARRGKGKQVRGSVKVRGYTGLKMGGSDGSYKAAPRASMHVILCSLLYKRASLYDERWRPRERYVNSFFLPFFFSFLLIPMLFATHGRLG